MVSVLFCEDTYNIEAKNMLITKKMQIRGCVIRYMPIWYRVVLYYMDLALN